MTTTRHATEIESTGTGDDREFALSCTCRTAYTSRLRSHAAAVTARRAHLDAVASGVWQAEQDAKAAAAEAAAPLNAAKAEHFDAVDAVRSAGFGVLIARQHGGDVEAARVELASARARLSAATEALAARAVPASAA